MSKNVVIVGGGLAGLAASIYLARGGRNVTIFEKRRYLGGRAITHLRHGYRFNLGAHALFRAGAAAAVYRELGVPMRGGRPPGSGIALTDRGRFRLPGTFFSLLATGMLSPGAKAELAKILWSLRSLDPARIEPLTVAQWLDQRVSSPVVRDLLAATIRLATYADQPERQSAAAALAHLRIAMRGAVYVDEGWQKLVDSLHSHAVAAGVNFVSSSRVVAVDHDGESVRGIELGGLEEEQFNDTLSIALPEVSPQTVRGTRLKADTVLLAVDPLTSRELLGSTAPAAWSRLEPVTVTCLDVALSSLPDRKNTFALGIDRPHYFSVHSAHAQLTPRGGALIHVAKYRKGRAAINDEEIESEVPRHRNSEVASDERELESLLDDLQPGWRERIVHRRFLPSMTASNALVTPGMRRPGVSTSIRGLHLAGDWVGEEGLLSDAALASARLAAQTILQS